MLPNIFIHCYNVHNFVHKSGYDSSRSETFYSFLFTTSNFWSLVQLWLFLISQICPSHLEDQAILSLDPLYCLIIYLHVSQIILCY